MKRRHFHALCIVILAMLLLTSCSQMHNPQYIDENQNSKNEGNIEILPSEENPSDQQNGFCSHDWQDATCENPRACKICGETVGTASEHVYSDATYTTPQTCIYCGTTIGDVLRISNSCDKVLASGYEENGDHYELVANESESFDGIKVEIGIIKNNTWLLEPTSDSPFIDDDGTILGQDVTSIYDENNLTVVYIGNGCFLCESYSNKWIKLKSLIYSCETNQFYTNELTTDYKHVCLTSESLTPYYFNTRPDYNNIHRLSKENNIVILNFTNYERSPEIEMLDTTQMRYYTIRINTPEDWFGIEFVYPLSEGIFAVVGEKTGQRGRGVAFYDEKGNPMIKNDYTVTTGEQDIVFTNGFCTFDIININKTEYTICIDKNGTVVSSTEK